MKSIIFRDVTGNVTCISRDGRLARRIQMSKEYAEYFPDDKLLDCVQPILDQMSLERRHELMEMLSNKPTSLMVREAFEDLDEVKARLVCLAYAFKIIQE